MKFYINERALEFLNDFDTFIFRKVKNRATDICFVEESKYLREKLLNETISEYMDMCESLSSQLNTKIKTATPQELLENPHVSELVKEAQSMVEKVGNDYSTSWLEDALQPFQGGSNVTI